MESEPDQFKPPYMSFQTFWNFIAELGSKPLPPRIDRSLMSSKSGTDQNNLTSALTSFGLVDAAGVVSPRLRRLAQGDEAERKRVLAEIVRQYYTRPLAVSTANDTEAALHDAFRDAYGLNAAETRRKCETFFLHALRVAELPVSPHFKQTRPGSGAPGAPKAKRSPQRRKSVQDGKPPTPPAALQIEPQAGSGAELVIVDLGDAGRVTMLVDVRWLQLDEETFLALRRNVNAMRELALQQKHSSDAGDPEDVEAVEF